MFFLATALIVTNLAGNAISVDPAAMKYPMSIFPPSEQVRIRVARGEVEKGPSSDRSKRVREGFQNDLKRAEARHAAGRMTDEELAKKRAAIAAALKKLEEEGK